MASNANKIGQVRPYPASGTGDRTNVGSLSIMSIPFLGERPHVIRKTAGESMFGILGRWYTGKTLTWSNTS